MKQIILSILSIGIGGLTIFMGVRDYDYKLLPQVMYFIFGAILILLGVYKVFEIISERKDENN